MSSTHLSPEKTLELAKVCLENARKTKDPEVALALCDQAGTVLDRVKDTAKVSTSSTDPQDQTLRDGIIATYLEIGKLQDDLQRPGKARDSFKGAEKWG